MKNEKTLHDKIIYILPVFHENIIDEGLWIINNVQYFYFFNVKHQELFIILIHPISNQNRN